MAQDWLDRLNPAQRQAAACGDGPVLVIAGAGTGKTMTLAARVAHLVERGVPAQRILLLTFTRRAAAEMLSRAAQMVGNVQTQRVWGGTFHATANRLLREFGRAVGLTPKFTVMDQADAADMMNLIRSDLGLAKTKRRFPRKATLAGIYSRCVNARQKLDDALEEHYPWCIEEIDGIRQVFDAYTRAKHQQNVLDYDDLLLFWKALCETPGTGRTVAGLFDHILVDEYQDTNLVQAEILAAMRRENHNLMVVGDDAQSIYSFRAATVRNILDFPQQFAGTRVVKLEHNYRSTQPILDASNAVMAQAAQRYTKDLFTTRAGGAKPSLVTCVDEADQCQAVCARVLEKLEEGVPLRQQAVLFRVGHHSDLLEVELTRRNIPFVKYGGLKFIEAAHVKDMLAILRILENPADELAWFRVLQLLEGVGPASARKIIADLGAGPGQAVDREATDVAGVIDRLLRSPPPVPAGAREQFASMRQALLDCWGAGRRDVGKRQLLTPAEQVERIRRFYDPLFERIYNNPTVRLRDLEQLEQIASGYKSRSAFLTDLTLDPPSSTQDLAGPPLLDEDYLILSTIHSAKGCEWQVVHILHAVDGMMPSDMVTGSAEQIDEERRLFYVAMTRAKDTLNVYFPLRSYFSPRGRGDRHSFAQLTRFITPADLRHYQRAGRSDLEKPVSCGAQSDAPPRGSVAAVDAMLKDLW